jgi:hypothetical protein
MATFDGLYKSFREAGEDFEYALEIEPPATPEVLKTVWSFLMQEAHSIDLIQCMIHDMLASKLPSQVVVLDILDKVIDHNRSLPNVVTVPCDTTFDAEKQRCARIVVVGDLHGQFRDLLAIILDDGVGGMPTEQNCYVFNGDIVDRGDMSVETVLTIFLMQLVHPAGVYVLRGNHETTIMNNKCGFEKEVLQKYGCRVLERFRQAFRFLPFAAVVGDTGFIAHGGLGKKSHQMSVAQLNKLDRISEPTVDTAIWELLWSGKNFAHCLAGYACVTVHCLYV